MKRFTKVCLMLVVICCSHSIVFSESNASVRGLEIYQNGKKNTKIIKADDEIAFRVEIKGKMQALYVGATLVNADDVEQDIDVETISLKRNAIVELSCNISESLDAGMSNATEPIKYIISLWEGKVYKDECAEKSSDGEPCKYCKANGYHMEGKIDSTEWRVLGYFLSIP